MYTFIYNFISSHHWCNLSTIQVYIESIHPFNLSFSPWVYLKLKSLTHHHSMSSVHILYQLHSMFIKIYLFTIKLTQSSSISIQTIDPSLIHNFEYQHFNTLIRNLKKKIILGYSINPNTTTNPKITYEYNEFVPRVLRAHLRPNPTHKSTIKFHKQMLVQP